MSENNYKNKFEQIDQVSLGEVLFKFEKWLFFLKRNKNYFLIAIIFGIITGWGYKKFDQPKYNAILTFVVEEDKGGLSGGALGIVSQFFDGGSNTSLFTGSNLLDLIKSRLIVENTLLSSVEYDGKQVSLIELYYLVYNKEDIKILKQNLLQERSRDSVLNLVYKKVIKQNLNVVQKDKKLNILTIEVESINEEFSKFFCERIVNEVSNFYIKTKSKKAKDNLDILQKQADSIRNKLNESIFNVATSTDMVYNLNSSLNVKRVNITKKQFDVQANTTALTQIITNLELAKISLRKETPLIQIIDKPKSPLEKKQVNFISAIIFSVISFLFLTLFLLVAINFMKKINYEFSLFKK
jgi:uncharacterized protein involved in exopolysaccharide biosynthesis